MATRSLFGLVMVRSVRILLECFLVCGILAGSDILSRNDKKCDFTVPGLTARAC